MAGREPFHPLSYVKGDLARPNLFTVTFEDEALRLLCNKITLQMPKSTAIPVPWMTGVMQLAGRMTNPFSFSVSFYAGTEGNYNTLKFLYEWRNKCINHTTGVLGLPAEYKKEVGIILHNTNYSGDGGSSLYNFECKGVWPIEIQDINLDVSSDSLLELQTTFAADIIHMA